jgi:hypothetical protein
MEHSANTLITPDTYVETPEVTYIEEKVANLYDVIEHDSAYLIGSNEMRAEFRDVLAEVHKEIDKTFTSQLSADKLHRDLDRKVADCFDQAVQRVVANGEVTNDFLDVIKDAPVGLESLMPHIDKWHNAAIKAQKEVDMKPKHEQSGVQQQADVIAIVAAEYGAGIPAVQEGQRIVQSGEQYKLDWLRSARKEARGKDPESRAKFEAINKVCVAAYGSELKDPNALIEKVATVARRTVASVAVAGVLSALPQFAAHADSGPKTTEVVPDSTLKSEKAVKLDEKVTIIAPMSTPEVKQPVKVPEEDEQNSKDEKTIVPAKPEKKPESNQPKNAITIPDSLIEVPAATPKQSDEKNPETGKKESQVVENDVDKSGKDKAVDTPKSEVVTPESPSKKEADTNDHAILIDPSQLISPNEKSDDKSNKNDGVSTHPVNEQAPADKVKDRIDENVVTIIDGVVKIDEDKLDKKTDLESNESEKLESDDGKTPKIIDGVITLAPENLGKDTTATEEVLISPTLEIPKPPIIEIPTHKQDTPKQEQGPSTPQGDYTQAAEKLAAKGGVWERVSIAMNFFMNDTQLAMTPSQAAGLIGNLMGETYGDMNPGQHQGGGPAFGIAQWEGGRLMDLGAFAGKNQADFRTQLEFIKYELLGKERYAFDMIKTAKNREEAAVLVRKYYERPSAHRDDERKAYANQVGDAFNAEYQAILASRIPKQETNTNGILAGWPTTGEDAMKLFNQCDPRWGEIRTPNGVRACDVSCGPTSVAMAVNALTGKDLNPGDVIRMTNDKRLWLPGDQGTSFDAVINLGKNFGINGAQMQNFKDINAYREILKNGGMILVAGSGPAPFVAPSVGAHFVLIRGITEDGKFLVADPYPKTPDTNTGAWNAQPILDGTFGAVVFTK